MGIPYKTMKHPKQNSLGAFCKSNPDVPECKPQEVKDIEDEHKKAQEMVEDILRNDTRARNQDLWLILQIWQKSQQIKVFVPFDKLNDMISPETITRARRRVQNTDEMYLPTDPKVLLRRRVKESVLRKYFADNKKLLDEYDEEKRQRA